MQNETKQHRTKWRIQMWISKIKTMKNLVFHKDECASVRRLPVHLISWILNTYLNDLPKDFKVKNIFFIFLP